MSYPTITSNPVKGIEALRRQLGRLGYNSDSEIWVKVKNNIIHTAKLTENGLAVWECWKEKDEKGKPLEDPKGGSTWHKGKYYPNGYEYLLSRAEAGEEMFFIVNHPIGGIGAYHPSKFTSIFIECDVDTIEDQWRKVNWGRELGLIPSAIVFSGGKSLHVYFSLSTPVDRDTWHRLQRKAIAVYTSDPVIQNHNREMRLSGFPRPKKGEGRYQSLDFESDVTYTPEEFESLLNRAGGGFPHGLSEERWKEIFRVLRERKLPHQEKEALVRQASSLPEEELAENKRLKEVEIKRSKRCAIDTFGSNNLLDAITQASVKLGADAFDWAGHKWRWDSSSKARGCCPWHESASGTSAWIAPRKNGDGWGFACLTCTDNRQMNAFSYWWQLKHGLGAAYPAGKEWVQAAKEFCLSAGVVVPELPPLERWDEPDAQAYDEYLKQEAEREEWEEGLARYSSSKQQENKVQWLAAYPERVRWTQERLKSLAAFNPIIQNTKFVELLIKDFLPKEEPQQPPIYNQDAQVSTQRADYSLTNLPSGLYGFVTQMGGGKTTLMLKVIREFKEGNLISFRNSVLTQTCHNEQVKDIIHFLWDLEESNDRRKWIRARDGWMAACVESIAKCRPKEVLILEEVEKIKNSLLVSSTCRRDRRERLREFVRHLHAAKYVFCCDADLSGSTLSWLQAIAGGKKINVIQNIRQRFQWQCYFFSGAKELLDNGMVKEYPNKRADFELNLLSKFARGEKLLIAADSQRWGESIERALLMVNPGAKGLRVDSITKADDATKDEVNAFLRDPNKWIEENQPDYIIYTPTCEASLDITIEDYFDAVFGCFVHINHLSCKQMLGRLRTNAPRFIFAKTHAINDDGGSKSPLPQVVGKHMFQHNFETIREILLAEYPEIQDDFQLLQKMNEVIDFESKQYKDPHVQALVEARAMDNFSRANLRKNLAEELERCGHIISWVNPGDAEAKSASAPFRKEIMMEWSEAIANAEDIDIETAWEIQQSMTANLEDRHKATKAILKERLPEFVLTSNFVYKCYLDDRQWINRQEMRYLLDYPEIAKTLDRDRWASGLKFDTAWWDVRTNSLTIKALRTLKIPEIARSGKSWDKDTDWVLEFKERAIANSKLVKLALGITATEESDGCYLLRRCLERVGYPVKGKQRRVGNGERVRFYQVDAAVLSETSGIYHEVYQSIGKRFAEKLNKLEVSQSSHIEISTRAVCDTREMTLPEVLRLIEESTPPPNTELTSDQREVLEGNLQLLPECENWEMFESLVECWDEDFRALIWHNLPNQEKQRIRSLAIDRQAIAS